MRLDTPLSHLRAYIYKSIGLVGRSRELRIDPLSGGFVSAGVYQLTLQVDLPGGEVKEFRFVQKYSGAAEVSLMRALSRDIQSEALPQVVASSSEPDNPSNPWFICPYYPGPALSWDDNVPMEVLTMLAKLHVYYENNVEQFGYLHEVDAVFFDRTIDQAIEKVKTLQVKLSEASFSDLNHKLARIRENSMLKRILAGLPLTLTHGDVHPGNLIRGDNGKAVLIDWGNARRSPAALDLANMVKFNSKEWKIYLAAREEAGALEIDFQQQTSGYHWATIQVNLQYLPFAVEHLPADQVLKMVDSNAAAQERIAAMSG